MSKVAVHYLSECTKTWNRRGDDGSEYETAVEKILGYKNYTIPMYRITHPSGKEEFFDLQGTPSDGSYYKRREEITVSKEGLSYKDALEWMTLNAKQPLYDEQGNKYLITCCELRVNGVAKSDPFCQLRFKNTKFFTSKPKPKPVYIPFWDAVKAAGQDGKCISKFENQGGVCLATYRYRSEYPTEWQYWNDGTNMWHNAYGFLNHSIDQHGTTYWAIVEDPSHSN